MKSLSHYLKPEKQTIFSPPKPIPTTTAKWLGDAINCNICKDRLDRFVDKMWFVDGRTVNSHWAVMCPECFEYYGVGLGVGKGQKYDFNTLEKIDDEPENMVHTRMTT